MIRPLRSTHRWLFVGLAVALPVALAAGLSSRAPKATRAAPVRAINPPSPDSITTGIGITYLGTRFTAKIGTGPEGTRFLVVDKTFDSVDPDLHLYWTPNEVTDALPGAGSYLIGTFSERPVEVFALPDGVEPNSGHLVLFSLAGGRVVDSAPFTVR